MVEKKYVFIKLPFYSYGRSAAPRVSRGSTLGRKLDQDFLKTKSGRKILTLPQVASGWRLKLNQDQDLHTTTNIRPRVVLYGDVVRPSRRLKTLEESNQSYLIENTSISGDKIR